MLVPKFVSNKIRTWEILGEDNQLASADRKRFGLQTLDRIIKKEHEHRGKLLAEAEYRKHQMWSYERRQYVLVRNLLERESIKEMSVTRKKLERKLSNLERKSKTEERSGKDKQRVTCIDCTLSEAERTLLEKGPKFVPHKGKFTGRELQEIESNVETMISNVRRKAERAMSVGREGADTEDESRNGGMKEDKRDDSDEERQTIVNEVKLLRLKGPQSRVKQPEKVDGTTENKMHGLKERILRAYSCYRVRKPNTTKKERMALKTLREKDLVIKPSDKSKSLVVMSKEAYKEKCLEILTVGENYEETDMSKEVLQQIVEKELKKVKSLKASLPTDIYKGLIRKNAKLPEFYGLPKTHKPGTPMRPVVAAFDGPLSGVSIVLERILNQLLKFVPAHIENTLGAVRSLEKSFPELKVPHGTIIVSMDVVALYPSIPIHDGIKAVMEKLAEHQSDVDLLGMSLEEVEGLLNLVLNNNYFKFDDAVYKQRHGVAMGNHLAPPFAIVFMDKLERKMLITAQKAPEFFDRYVDDCLMAWIHGEEELLEFMTHINSQHPNIRFTWQHSLQGRTVNFMDMSIRVTEELQLEYGLYQKPSDSGVNLNYESAIPEKLKMSVATQQFRRATSLSSNIAKERESQARIVTLLSGNAFPGEAIEKAYKRSKVEPFKRKEEEDRCMLKLPYGDAQLHKEVTRLCRATDLPIRIVYEESRSLERMLVRSAFRPPTCEVHGKYVKQQNKERRGRGKPMDDCVSCQAGLSPHMCDRLGTVYLLTCKLCGQEYVGESHRKLRERVKEHHAQARNRMKGTPWGEHLQQHPEVIVGKKPIFVAKVISTSKTEMARKFREAIEIRDRKPPINKSKGWVLT